MIIPIEVKIPKKINFLIKLKKMKLQEIPIYQQPKSGNLESNKL